MTDRAARRPHSGRPLHPYAATLRYCGRAPPLEEQHPWPAALPPRHPQASLSRAASPTCEVTTYDTHNLFAPQMFSDLCNLQLMSCRLIVISFVCVRVLRNLIKACSWRIQGVQTILRSRQCKLLTCADNCSLRTQGGRRGTRAVLSRWGTSLATCRPLCTGSRVPIFTGGVYHSSDSLYVHLCVHMCVYTHVQMRTHVHSIHE